MTRHAAMRCFSRVLLLKKSMEHTEAHEDQATEGCESSKVSKQSRVTHEYEAKAVVMAPEISSSSLRRSARAAKGRPQFATCNDVYRVY